MKVAPSAANIKIISMTRSTKFRLIFLASLLLIGGSFNWVVVNLFFSMIEVLKNDCNVSKLKKAAFVPPFLVVTYLLLKAFQA